MVIVLVAVVVLVIVLALVIIIISIDIVISGITTINRQLSRHATCVVHTTQTAT